MAVSNAVNSTLDYKKFTFLIANRETAHNHITNLKESIQKHPEILEAQPILVNEHFQIIDGQHRFQAASELGMPIYYTQIPGLGIETARTMNVLQRRWEPVDYAKSYALTGNKHYSAYLKARQDFGLQHNITMAALTTTKGKGLNTIFKRGEFEVVDLVKARKNMGRIVEIGEISPVPVTSVFAFALLEIFDSADFKYDVFLRKFREHAGNVLRRTPVITENLRMFEEIYNANAREKVRLF